jgi:hypothetical protein
MGDAADVEQELLSGPANNELWLRPDNANFPALTILVLGAVAAIHYFPADRHPGFQSVGKLNMTDAKGTITFRPSGTGEPVEIAIEAVISKASAVLVAKEFSNGYMLPACIEWLEL